MEAINNVSSLLSDSSTITSGTAGIIDALNDFSDDYANISLNGSAGGNVYVFPCDICTEISSTVGDTAQQIDDETNEIFDDLNETLVSIQGTVIETNVCLVFLLSLSRMQVIRFIGNHLRIAYGCFRAN